MMVSWRYYANHWQSLLVEYDIEHNTVFDKSEKRGPHTQIRYDHYIHLYKHYYHYFVLLITAAHSHLLLASFPPLENFHLITFPDERLVSSISFRSFEFHHRQYILKARLIRLTNMYLQITIDTSKNVNERFCGESSHSSKSW